MKEEEIVREFIEMNRGRAVFQEHEAKALFRQMGFNVPEGKFFRIGEEIPEPPGLRFPVVAKVSSSKIVSKTDVGGVKSGIRDREALMKAFRELSLIKDAEGVLVEEMAPQGLEVIIGGAIDNQFGPVVMFGLGGIFVELFKDVSFGLSPLAMNDARWLIRQVKGYRLLQGYRGKPAVDESCLLTLIVSVSEVMATGLVEEIDLNPVALYPEGAVILDAKMRALS